MWNYRIIQFDNHRSLHEVFYNKDGSIWYYTEEPISFVENLDEKDGIKKGLKMVLKDISAAPILIEKDIKFGKYDE